MLRYSKGELILEKILLCKETGPEGAMALSSLRNLGRLTFTKWDAACSVIDARIVPVNELPGCMKLLCRGQFSPRCTFEPKLSQSRMLCNSISFVLLSI